MKQTEVFTQEALQKLIEQVRDYQPSPEYIVVPRQLLAEEVANHPERLKCNKDGTFTWCGYAVYTFGERYESN